MPAITLIRINRRDFPIVSEARRFLSDDRSSRRQRTGVSEILRGWIVRLRETDVEANVRRPLTHIKTKPGRERYPTESRGEKSSAAPIDLPLFAAAPARDGLAARYAPGARRSRSERRHDVKIARSSHRLGLWIGYAGASPRAHAAGLRMEDRVELSAGYASAAIATLRQATKIGLSARAN
jgi:hypothetical protein